MSLCGIWPDRWLQLDRLDGHVEDSIGDGVVISFCFSIAVSDKLFQLAENNWGLFMSNNTMFSCQQITQRGDCQHRLFDLRLPPSRDRKSATPRNNEVNENGQKVAFRIKDHSFEPKPFFINPEHKSFPLR